MTYDNIVTGTFLKRPNRFIAYVEVKGDVKTCHVKNTGRCQELFSTWMYRGSGISSQGKGNEAENGI